MIVEHQRLNLFEKLLFEKVVIVPPFKKHHPMPDEACFLYIFEGEYNSISETQQLRISSQEAVLMKCSNYLSQFLKSAKTEKYEAIAVHFFPEVLQKVYRNDIPEFLKHPQKNNRGPDMAKFDGGELLKKYIESIAFYFENPGLVEEELLILKLKELIMLLVKTKNAPVVQQILSGLFSPNQYSFKEIIEAHIYSPITISELAQLTNLSESSFKRQFKKIYKDSPARYLRNKKVEKAAALLSVSEERIGDIAFDCGFSDVAHFSATFKKITGLSPSNYRLNHIHKTLA